MKKLMLVVMFVGVGCGGETAEPLAGPDAAPHGSAADASAHDASPEGEAARPTDAAADAAPDAEMEDASCGFELAGEVPTLVVGHTSGLAQAGTEIPFLLFYCYSNVDGGPSAWGQYAGADDVSVGNHACTGQLTIAGVDAGAWGWDSIDSIGRAAALTYTCEAPDGGVASGWVRTRITPHPGSASPH